MDMELYETLRILRFAGQSVVVALKFRLLILLYIYRLASLA